MRVARRKKIVVLGMMSKMPVPGNIWLVAQYLIGFQRLGFDVYYVEAHGMTPFRLMHQADDDAALLASEFIAGVMKRFNLSDRWAFHSRYEDRYFGMSDTRLRDLYQSADLLINLHGGTVPLPEHSATGRLIYLETDPVQLQVELHNKDEGAVKFLEPHVAFFSWGLNYGNPSCRVPQDPRFDFKPTCPPVLMDFWQPHANGAGPLFTTVGNWRQGGAVTYQGETYYWSKDREFRKFLELPSRVGSQFELALSSCPDADRALLTSKGWRVRDPIAFSADLDKYRRYICESRGEFTVAKDQNVRLRSGWFSERSATYLAAGRPVITQDTGFGSLLPTGEGLFAFSTVEEAADAIKEINADYERHSRAARAIAADHFRHDVNLTRLLTDCGLELGHAGSASAASRRPSYAGVNVCGYLRTESGVGAAARSYVRALRRLDVPVALNDVSALSGNRAEDGTLSGFVADQPFETNLVCVDVEKHHALLSHFGEDFFRNRYNIGVWWWEVQGFPRKWWDRFAYYDEIWVGTSFIANNLAPVAPVPVIRIPPVLAPESYGDAARGRRLAGVEPDEFLFLFVFDVNSTMERKNPGGVIEAFKQAFVPSNRVRLAIKCVNGASNQPGLAELRRQIGAHPVTLLDGYWPMEQMRDLTAGCDAYVSLHRSEGLGLTIADAMAHGKPVIATGWSGNTDLMHQGNCFPVEYRLVDIPQNTGLYGSGGRWAEPSTEHAAQLMRTVSESREAARSRGEAARRDIEAHYSENAVSRLVEARLHAISIRRRWPAFKRKMQGVFGAYRRLVQHTIDAVGEVVPAEATVAVVSKGDAALLNLPVRAAWHFPQLETGAYAGYYPADSAEAISHLEDLRARGADYLVLPSTAFWWLDHYRVFAEHLGKYEVIQRDETCLIYSLTSSLCGTESLRVLQPVRQHE